MTTLRERDFEAFFQAPFDCYGEGSLYVSPMRSDLLRFLDAGKNPLFANDQNFTYFIVHHGNRVLGRITAHLHRASNETHGLRRAYFGFFDCADDPDAASLLLGAAEAWARRQRMTEIAGNFNLTAMQQIGVMTEGFDAPAYTDHVYSPPHIHRLLDGLGYEAVFPMSTFEIELEKTDPARLLGDKQREILDSPDFQWAPVTRWTLSRRLEDARLVLNDGFADNPMFVPVTREEYDFQAKEMKWIMDPRISTVLHHKGAPVGVMICIPDLNPFLRATRSRLGPLTPWWFLRHRLNRKRAVLIYYSVSRHLHGRGINPAMLHRVLTAMKSAGYETLGCTWIADVNRASLRQQEKIGSTPLHRLHLYRRDLTEGTPA